jgi:hypothetical protein
VLSLTEAGSTEIEAQHGESETLQRLHGVKDHFVMQSSAEKRVGMANQGGMSGGRRTRIEDRFEASGEPVDKKSSDGSGGHRHAVDDSG